MNSLISSGEQAFLDEIDKKLWNAADRLRSNLDAAVYKHAVLGLIFLKYVSDAFDLRREELEAAFRDPANDDFLDRADYDSDAAYTAAIAAELEDRDYYTAQNVFWVPPLARWQTIRENAALAPDTVITLADGSPYTFRSAARLIDDALEAIEKENAKLKGIIEKNRYMQLQIEPAKLVGLISEVISSIPFTLRALTPNPSPKGRGEADGIGSSPKGRGEADGTGSSPKGGGETDGGGSSPAGRGGGEGMAENSRRLNAKDILGHVYEYFLGQFALAEGKKGGQYYTPKSIVSLIVEMLQPYSGKVYDPAMGSGGFFVQSESFIEAHGGRRGAISVYGQESNPTTWRLAAMNMAIRGIDFNFGKQPADTFLNDQHPDLRADYVMANPPFNISEWWDGKLEGDPRWIYGTPPKSNANFAWVQHMLYHLAPTGSMALLLANGSMSSNTKGEGKIRRALVEADLVECMLALPGQLFTNTQIPACVWFLTKNKKACSPSPGLRPPSPTGRGAGGEGAAGLRDRRGEVLFIDARQLGYMKDRVLRDFTPADLEKITNTFHAWKRDPNHPLPLGEGQGEGESVRYQDVAGFCKSATLAEIAAHGFVLTPGRYVGAEETEDDGEPFEEKMQKLVAELNAQFAESAKLEQAIKENLKGLGYGE